MLKLILDMDFQTLPPAVDQSDFSCHGRILHAGRAPGRKLGSQALDFSHPAAAVRIALRPVWTSPSSLVVETWIRLRAHGVRHNIIEGDGSFALFVAADGGLVGSIFSMVEGDATPTWHSLSSTTDSPDGIPRPLPLGQWCMVTFVYDGVTSARLFIDGQQVASRNDYVAGIGPVGTAGVVIGNWTLMSQFAFDGLIDQVRVWKHDENALVKEFSRRPLGPEASDLWDNMLDCVRGHLVPHGRSLLSEIEVEWRRLIRMLFRALQDAAVEDLAAFRKALATYARHWREGSIEHPEHAAAVLAIREIADRVAGPDWTATFDRVAGNLAERLAVARQCVDAGALGKADPAFRAFIKQVVMGLASPNKGEV
ncbi:LamG domain-containing protein [Corallococcus coralloides]|nr:LamG domain-containing protein [Corallococcus coralloides]